VSEKLGKFREKPELRRVWLAFLSLKEEYQSLHSALVKIRTGNIPNTSPELEPTGCVPAEYLSTSQVTSCLIKVFFSWLVCVLVQLISFLNQQANLHRKVCGIDVRHRRFLDHRVLNYAVFWAAVQSADTRIEFSRDPLESCIHFAKSAQKYPRYSHDCVASGKKWRQPCSIQALNVKDRLKKEKTK